MRADPKSGLGGGVVLALLVIYLVWGSTYLAIRFAIETLPPFTMAGARFLLAGAILYAFARLRGAPRPQRAQWRTSALIGGLLLLGGNGGVVWAETRIPSGVTALLVAVEPVWIALLAPWVLGHRRVGGRAVGGLVAGVAGVAVLVIDPRGLDPSAVDLVGAVVVVVAALSWAIGSLFAVRADLPQSRAAASGMQMLCGGALLALAGAASGEWGHLVAGAAPSTRSLLAFGYLVVIGSIVGFSTYAYLLRSARPTVAATYAFVNPVVAVFLGWLAVGEPLGWRVGLASALILSAVALLISEGRSDRASESGTTAEEEIAGASRRAGELPRDAAGSLAPESCGT